MSNLYHILFNNPALEAEDMYAQLEQLAEMLVHSGRLRIDAQDKINFARFYLPYDEVSMMFSKRELTDPRLTSRTKKVIIDVLSRKFSGNRLIAETNKALQRLRDELSRYQVVKYELEMKLARLIVQSAHPVVIMLMIMEQVEVFVSYSYNIGDMMDITSWQEVGENSGLQSMSFRKYSIFTSAAGDPFADTEKDSIYGDGFPAMARMMVIIAQEIGHYSDVVRDQYRRPISRHSADLYGRRAKENVRIARLKDIENVIRIRNYFAKRGLRSLAEAERHFKFFKQKKRYGIVMLLTRLQMSLYNFIFVMRCPRLSFLIKALKPEKYLASKINAMLDDMQFNLEPKADVYTREDKQEEEAIACIEALARVPQQCVKWGKNLTKYIMPNLYNIYYDQVIPSCIKHYEILTGKKFHISTHKKLYPLKRIKKLFKKKPKFKQYKIWEY
jgi:hypothetical protein